MSRRADQRAVEQRARALIDGMGRYEEAVTLLSAELSRGGNCTLWCLLSLACYSLRRWDEALEAGRRAVELDPNNDWAYRLVGCALCALGTTDEGLEALEAAIKLAPGSYCTWGDYARQAVQHGQVARARDAIERSLALAPNDVLTLTTASYIFGRCADWEACERAATKALELDPTNATALRNLGWSLTSRGQHDAAITAYQRAVAARPHDRTSVTILTDNLVLVGRYDEAVALYREFLAYSPDDALAWCGLCYALERGHQFPEAFEAAERACELDPECEWAFRLRAEAHWRAGAREQAMRDARRASELRHPRPDAPAFGWLFRAGYARRLGRSDEAAMCIARAAELSPEYLPVYSFMASHAMHEGRPEDARRAAEEAAKRDPASAHTARARGYAALAAGQWADAIEAFDYALEIDEYYCCPRAARLIAQLQLGTATHVEDQLGRIQWDHPDCDCPLVKRVHELRGEAPGEPRENQPQPELSPQSRQV